MLKHFQKWSSHPFLLSLPPPFSCKTPSLQTAKPHIYTAPNEPLIRIKAPTGFGKRRINARRRVIYEEEGGGDEEEYGYNEEIAVLETYSQSMRDEVLLVHARVDEEEVEVVIFKGFSSCLSYATFADPSRSVLPARAVIQSIDRVKGPFDPSNVQFIEKGLNFDAFKKRFVEKN